MPDGDDFDRELEEARQQQRASMAQALEEVARRLRAGELDAVVLAGVTANELPYTLMPMDEALMYRTLGPLARLTHQIHRSLDGMEQSVPFEDVDDIDGAPRLN